MDQRLGRVEIELSEIRAEIFCMAKSAGLRGEIRAIYRLMIAVFRQGKPGAEQASIVSEGGGAHEESIRDDWPFGFGIPGPGPGHGPAHFPCLPRPFA